MLSFIYHIAGTIYPGWLLSNMDALGYMYCGTRVSPAPLVVHFYHCHTYNGSNSEIIQPCYYFTEAGSYITKYEIISSVF